MSVFLKAGKGTGTIYHMSVPNQRENCSMNWVNCTSSEGATVLPLTYDKFQSKLKMALRSAGIAAENYSRLSFWRGGLHMLLHPC